jgi:DNA (cytosine-5)-methyltransferase 1
MTHGSLFSGIGGFDLAAQWMGWENKFHCEINEFCNQVLKYYWPNAERYTDIKSADFSIWRHRIDILSGGFPCQPYSAAGKRKGKEDDRHLWPEMLKAIRTVQPRWVVGENVYGIVNWSGGLVFDEVQSDLENEGYQVTPYILPACAVDAPHRRDRVWFVAHANSERQSISAVNGNSRRGELGLTSDTNERSGQEHELPAGRQGIESGVEGTGVIADTVSIRGRSWNDKREHAIYADTRCKIDGYGKHFEGWPTQSPLCFRNDGLSNKLAGITFSKHRNESIKAYGNAIVPQVAYQIFKAIEQYENQ